MKYLNRRTITLALIFMAFLVIVFFVPGEGKNKKIKIGVAEDSSGLLIHYMMNKKGFSNVSLKKQYEAYSIKDCCSSTSQWALSTELLDVAIMCPSAAKNLIAKDKRFEIIGPCVLNSDIFVIKPGVIPKAIGVPQNRYHIEKIVREKYGQSVKIIPMITSALPYALEKGTVDCIVIDAVKALFIKGNKEPSYVDHDNETYVLVVSEGFKKGKQYEMFNRIFKETVEELKDEKKIIEEINSYKNTNVTGEEMKKWNQFKVKLVYTTL